MSEDKKKASSETTAEPAKKSKEKRSGKTPNRKRSILSLRKLLVVAGLLGAGILVLAVVGFIALRTGAVDSYVKNQFTTALDEMGVTMKAGRFELGLSPLTLYIENARFTNKKTGQNIAAAENMTLHMSVLDLFAMSSTRNVSIDRTAVNGLDVWIDFDKDGKSNFDGIEILPPKNAVRFQVATTQVSVLNSKIHFGDEVHTISGNAQNVSLFLKPDSVRPPDSEDLSFNFDFASKKSNFIYDKSEVEPVDIEASGRIHPDGAEISNLVLKTPIGSSTLSGNLTNWKELAYDLKLKSTIDLTQTSSIFPMGTAIAGVGNFEGTVTGKGTEYRIKGDVTSDSLAASNVRLKGLRVSGTADGEGSSYRANGKAVAELLTFEDFKIDFPSMIGSVRGSGSDFKWFGELQAAAVRSPLGTVGSLIISDGVAEYEDNRLVATLGNVRARKFTNDSVNLESIQTGNIRIASANGVIDALIPRANAASLDIDGAKMRGIAVESARVNTANGRTTVTAARGRVDDYQSGDTKLRGMRAGDLKVQSVKGRTSITASTVESDEVRTGSSKTEGVTATGVTVDVEGRDTRVNSKSVRVARVDTDSAILANLNIAGVRLTVRDGVIEGETADFEAGDIDFKGKRIAKKSIRKKARFCPRAVRSIQGES